MFAEIATLPDIDRLLLDPCILCGQKPADVVEAVEPIVDLCNGLIANHVLFVPVCEDCLEDRPIEVEQRILDVVLQRRMSIFPEFRN